MCLNRHFFICLLIIVSINIFSCSKTLVNPKKAPSDTSKTTDSLTKDTSNIITAVKLDTTVAIVTTVFQQGINGYRSYRIPVLLNTQNGSLLAFCEGRRSLTDDSGDVDVLFKRSTDNGATWSKQKVVFSDGVNTCGNPALVQDQKTGTIWLLMSHNKDNNGETTIIKNNDSQGRTVWLSSSVDDGVTWSVPKEITSSVKNNSMYWYATGPATGIQIQYGAFKGRLIIPCDHSYRDANNQSINGSHIVYSDDDGASWHMGGNAGPNSNECQVVELANKKGTLLMNSRYYGGLSVRSQSYSYDGGLTWTKPAPVMDLIDPICEGSIYRYSWGSTKTKACLLLSNLQNASIRTNLTLKRSDNEGLTWSHVTTIHKGPAGYSSLSVLNNNVIAVLYECGLSSPYESVVFKSLLPLSK